VLRCDFCQRFIVGSVVDGMAVLGDGRYLCGSCSGSAVMHEEDARRLMADVSALLSKVGLVVNHGAVELHLVDREELQSISSANSHDTRGFTDYVVKKNLFGRVRHQSINVYLLRGLTEAEMMGTLAHELTHVWQFIDGRLDQDEAVSEGSCNYAAYLVLRRLGGRESEFLIENMLKDEDPVYGEGFRRVKRYAEKKGLASWIKLLKKRQTLSSLL
jgi:hypothetical protein